MAGTPYERGERIGPFKAQKQVWEGKVDGTYEQDF